MITKGKIKIGGLENKIFNLCLMLVIGAILIFAILGILRVKKLSEMANEASLRQTTDVKEISENSMHNEIEDRVIQVGNLNARIIDKEFWALAHDQELIALQVGEIIKNADDYEPVPLELPDASNEGVYSLQLLVPEGGSPEEDTDEMAIMGKIATLAPEMEKIVDANSEHLIECLISFPSGYSIIMDAHAEQKFDENGNLTPYNATTREWYIATIGQSGTYFSPVKVSYFDKQPEMQFARPVIVDGEIVAVVEGALRLNNLQKIASGVEISDECFSMLIGSDGNIIYTSKEIEDIDANSNEAFKKLRHYAFTQKPVSMNINVDGIEYYCSSAMIPSVGWSYVLFYPVDKIEESTNQILEKMDTVGTEAQEQYSAILKQTNTMVLIVVLLLIANAVIVALSFSRRILKPISLMTEKIKTLSDDNILFEMDDVYKTGDEIELLANAFSDLSGKTVQYIKKVMEVTAEKERLGAELDLANRIQANMLPKNFPLFPDRNEFSLFATMTPAKEVGGDLYDSFLIDDDHLCMVVGDVSGKGVPAALFMVISKTLIKSRTLQGGTPAEILSDVNDSLCDGNDEGLFVTVWIGILTISTGHVIESNGGHENPAIYRAQTDSFELIERKHGLALGAFPGVPYADDEFDISDGDLIFVYTDGVPEAQNVNDELYNNDRMLDALNRHKTDTPEELLVNIRNDINEFVGDAPQFDDLTMLAMRFQRCDKKQPSEA